MPNDTQGQLPLYQCHKQVRAAKIVRMEKREETGVTTLELDGGYSVQKNAEWFYRHKPGLGGYYVVYEDGYASYSPAAAFESGYTRA